MRRAFAAAALAAAAWACTDRLETPGRCPQYCPTGEQTVVDTILTASLDRDSAFRGFVAPHEATLLIAASLPWVDSRPILTLPSIAGHVALGSDTSAGRAVLGVDSARLIVHIARRDTAATNLRVYIYRLPKTIDSTTTFADAGVQGAFTDSLIDSVNVSQLIAAAGKRDSLGDSVVVDTTSHAVTLLLPLDSAQVAYSAADSGLLALGIRITADSLAEVAIGGVGSPDGGVGITRYIEVDSSGTRRPDTLSSFAPSFDSYVFNPPLPALDSTLVIGGMPTARSILRVNLPRAIRDSSQIIRATLILVPAVAERGTRADSFIVNVRRVEADFGAKSPLAVAASTVDSTYFGQAAVQIGATDTVTIELTQMVRFWQADTLVAPAMMLRQINVGTLGVLSEGVSIGEMRFFGSRTPALRPTLRLTYVPRFAFGHP